MKKIVLIGDSIRMGYDSYTKMAFEDVAEVYYPKDNCRFAAYTLRHLPDWKDQFECGDDVDCVHWNAGLWDCLIMAPDGEYLTPIELYKYYLERVCNAIKKLFPYAKVIFATSTPVQEELFWRNKRYNKDIEEYNNVGRDINLLQEVSRKSGVNIIASTGLYYTEDYFLRSKSPELLAEFFIDECLNGIGNTGIKPECLKCATNENGVTALNEKSLATMAIVQKNTGLPLYAHNYHQGKTPYDQIKVLEKSGINLEKLIVGHSSDSCDIDYLEDFLKLGCYLGFDRIGNSCEGQAKTLCTLISRGWEDKLLLSHDYSVFIDSQDYSLASYKETIFGSNRNYTTVSKVLLPMLRNMGVSEKQINKMMHDNPLQLMTKL